MGTEFPYPRKPIEMKGIRCHLRRLFFILGGNPGKADCRVFRAQRNVNTYAAKRKCSHQPAAKNIPFGVSFCGQRCFYAQTVFRRCSATHFFRVSNRFNNNFSDRFSPLYRKYSRKRISKVDLEIIKSDHFQWLF